MNYLDVLKSPRITEKLDKAQAAHNQYAFEIDREANKRDVRGAVEKLFKVHVVGVRTAIYRGKMKRIGRSFGKRPNTKMAFVTLKKGDEIALFKGKA